MYMYDSYIPNPYLQMLLWKSLGLGGRSIKIGGRNIIFLAIV